MQGEAARRTHSADNHGDSNNHGYSNNHGDSNNHVDTTTDSEINKVKIMSSNLLTLISQLETDHKDSEHSFRQKIDILDKLCRDMVQLLRTIQCENSDSKHAIERTMVKNKAEQLHHVIMLEERLSKIEETIHRSEYSNLAEGFTDVIQQYIDTANFTSPVSTRSSFQDAIQQLHTEMNEKLKSLNKRTKTEQSGIVKELKHVEHSMELFQGDMRSALSELEGTVNTCAVENRALRDKQADTASLYLTELTKVSDHIHVLDTRVATLEELEHKHSVEQEEDKRVEELEQNFKLLLHTVEQQNKRIEQLADENARFKAQIRRDLGLKETAPIDVVPTEELSKEELPQ